MLQWRCRRDMAAWDIQKSLKVSTWDGKDYYLRLYSQDIYMIALGFWIPPFEIGDDSSQNPFAACSMKQVGHV